MDALNQRGEVFTGMKAGGIKHVVLHRMASELQP
jgi:hypothetical protein